MNRLRCALAALLLVSCAAAQGGQETPDFTGGTRTLVSDPGGVRVSVSTERPEIALGNNDFVLAPFGGTVVRASGFMAAHGHGTPPAVIDVLPDGGRRVGLVLFMSGRWELTFELQRETTRETLHLDVQVP